MIYDLLGRDKQQTREAFSLFGRLKKMGGIRRRPADAPIAKPPPDSHIDLTDT